MDTKFRRLTQFVLKLYERTRAVVVALVEPPDSIQSLEDRHHARLLNSLLVGFAPLIFIPGVLNAITSHAAGGVDLTNFLSGTAALGLLLIIYLLVRLGHYRLAVRVIFAAGYFLIIADTIASPRPYFPINHLVLLALFGSVMFSLKTTAALSLLGVCTTIVVIALLPGTTVRDVLRYSSFAILIDGFILLFTYHRNRLEADRSLTLRQSGEKLRLLVEQLPAAVWTMNSRLELTSIQGRGYAGKVLSREKLISGLDAGMDPNVYETAMNRVLAGSPVTFTLAWNGAPYEHHVEPLRNKDGEIVGCIGVSVDIQERQQAAQRELELAAERERTAALAEFVEYASHDFRTPLSIMNTSLYLLKKDEDPASRQQRIATVEGQAARITTILEDMLLLLRLNRENRVEKVACPLGQVINSVYDYTHGRLADGLVTLIADLAPDLPVMMVNEADLRRAILNLIDNAVYHTPPGGQITLRAYRLDERVNIEVSDTGEGISEDDLPHIFDHFYRGEKSRPATGGSTGLGLSITRKIVELHNGTIHVSSQPGRGSSFVITLPEHVEPAAE